MGWLFAVSGRCAGGRQYVRTWDLSTCSWIRWKSGTTELSHFVPGVGPGLVGSNSEVKVTYLISSFGEEGGAAVAARGRARYLTRSPAPEPGEEKAPACGKRVDTI